MKSIFINKPLTEGISEDIKDEGHDKVAPGPISDIVAPGPMTIRFGSVGLLS